MSSFIKNYGKYYLLWVAYFISARAIFIWYHGDKSSLMDWGSIANTFVYGSRLDISMAGYYSVIPFVLLAVYAFLKDNAALLNVVKYFTNTLLFLSSFLIAADLELYKNWGCRLDDIALNTLKDPAETMASAGSSPVGTLIFIFICLTGISMTAFNSFIFKPLSQSQNKQNPIPLSSRSLKLGLGLFSMLVLIIPIRGGFQLAPVNQSAVYFSKNTFANHAAINALWNFYVTIFEKRVNKTHNKIFMDDAKANALLADLFKDSSQTKYLIKKDIKNPNFILITWESFTAKVVERMGGVKGVTPQFDALCKEGILFDSIYSAGHRTHFGLMATLGAYPCVTGYNIFDTPRKAEKMACMARNLGQKGYETSFYYGGEAEFANFKNYLITGQFSKLTTKETFDKKDLNSKWGAFDHVVLERANRDLAGAKEPFFSNILTLSSHEPFELPTDRNDWGQPDFKPTDDVDLMFNNAMYYTDKAVGEFISAAKKQPWWQNTIVVIIADHGSVHVPPHDDEFHNFHVPMLWLGGALAHQDTVIHTVGSQSDIAATVLGQLDMPHTEYVWSKNIMTTGYRPFAYFNYHNGFGFVRKDGKYAYDTEGGYIRRQDGYVNDKDIEIGKAYIQMTYQDYMRK